MNFVQRMNPVWRRQRVLWEKAVEQDTPYPAERFQGRGLVFCAGGERHFTNLWVNLSLIRKKLGCALPVEVWHFGRGEMSENMEALLERFQVRVVDGSAWRGRLPRQKDMGFALKTIALQHSSFEEVLFLDTENHPVRDPSDLFDEPSYLWSGACFWPDIVQTDPESAMWEFWNIPYLCEWEWESGQVLLHKRACWSALELAAHLNQNYPFFYPYTQGDKMTYYAAWKKRGLGFAMPPVAAEMRAVSHNRRVLHQFDFQRRLLFHHRVMADWDLKETGPKDDLFEFPHQQACEDYLEELRGLVAHDTFALAPQSGNAPHSPLDPAQVLSFHSTPKVLRKIERAEGCPPWESAACQVWKSPQTLTLRLMGQSLIRLRDPRPGELDDLLRYLAVLCFLDPRIIPLLPDHFDADGTRHATFVEKLRSFCALLKSHRGGDGRLWIHGPVELAVKDHPQAKRESELLQALAELLHSLQGARPWRQFMALTGCTPAHPCPSVRGPSMSFPKPGGKVLILTPIKDAVPFAKTYFENLKRLHYPANKLSLALLESDSRDGTCEIYQKSLREHLGPWRKTLLLQHHFDYHIPANKTRWHATVQYQRRSVLARSRNHLLTSALEDEDWVLWIDVDIIEYPQDILHQFLAFGKDILHPNCVLDYMGRSFDGNAWRDQGKRHLHDLKAEGLLVPLDAVGGTMLWVRADLFRQGLHFPETPYGEEHPKARRSAEHPIPGMAGEIETEGLGLMAHDMGVVCWGLPHLEILHNKG